MEAEDEGEEAEDEGEEGEPESVEPFHTTGLEPGELIAIEPGGDTICSRGTPFRYFVRGGSVNKVVVDFAGGGACWDQVTCSIADAIFNAEAPELELLQAAMDAKVLTGIYDNENEDNPFKDWFLIHIPYCTGDIHWGDSTVDYTENLQIQHRGLKNVLAALGYMEENIPSPDELFVTGCSAGAYGAILHSNRLAETYPDAKMRVLGDSGAGIITEDWFADSFPQWNAEATLPSWFELPGGSVLGLTIVDVYTEIANQHPDLRFAQYTTAFDSNQEIYYLAMGGEEVDWSGKMLASLKEIEEQTTNFTYYVTPGEVHCITPYSLMYQEPAVGPVVSDWLKDFIGAAELPAPIACSTEDCVKDVWCEECKTSDTPGSHCGHCITE